MQATVTVRVNVRELAIDQESAIGAMGVIGLQV
jgi:hypothetical protein